MMEDGVYCGSGDGGGSDRSGHKGGGVGEVMIIGVMEVVKKKSMPPPKKKKKTLTL